MTIDQAIYILRNTAWLGSNDERDETERAVEIVIKELLSAETEVIRCKDCIKREYCRTSTVWAVAPGDDWFCADAERREGDADAD